MIQTGFLAKEDREKLIAMTQDGSLTHRFARRANALVLLDEGWSCRQAAHAFLFDGGVFEIALRYRGDAFRALYAAKIDADIWVIHAFLKKPKSGIKTPQMKVDLIRERLKRLKEKLK